MTDRLIGRAFGDFRIDSLVGRGSVGRVYAATQQSLRRRVALKVLEEGLFTPDEFKVRFQREAEVIAALEHPNIVPIYAFGQQDNYLYYAMRFVEGKTLDVLMGEVLPPREGFRYLVEIASALEYAHARGVVHRDLKPSNIIVSEGAALLADFGLARLMETTTITATGALVGTPLYMAPEQAKRLRAGPPADVYSLGVIAYEIVCARHPFASNHDTPREAILAKIGDGDYPPPDEAPPAVRGILRELMALDPEARPARPRARLLAALDALPAGGGLEPPPSDAKTFGKFKLLQPLGHGGMGMVFRARQMDLNRDVAVKVLNFGPDADETAVLRFKREAQAAARLRHPNIIAVHEAGEVGGRPYFSMDLVEGQSLAAILEKGPLPPRRAMDIVRDVAAAIAHAHAEGIVHRDLKPGNVLLDLTGRVFVADFGLSKPVDLDATKLTQSGEVMGTPAYMAPEQARGGSALVDPRIDVYGMGAVLYHMLTGIAPFGNGDVYTVLHDLLTTDPPAPRSRNAKIHADAETICLKAMDKDPSRRYPSAAAFREDVERFIAGEPIEARPVTVWTKIVKRIKRNPLAAAFAGAALLSLLLGGAFGIYWLVQSRAASRREAAALRTQETRERAARTIRDAEDELARDLDDAAFKKLRAGLEKLDADLARDAATDPPLWFYRGEANRLLCRDAKAIECYTRAPGSPQAALGRARVRIFQFQDLMVGGSDAERRRNAESAVEMAPAILDDLKLAPQETAALLWIAYAEDRNADVEAGATREIARGGRNDEYYFLRALARLDLGRKPDAVRDLEAALDRNRGQPRYWVHLATLYEDDHEISRPTAFYGRALRLKPDYAVAFNNRGVRALLSERHAEALADIDRALAIEDAPIYHMNRGDALNKLGRYPEAIAEYDRAISGGVDRVRTFVGRGSARKRLGDLDAALADYRRAHDADPGEAHALMAIAEVHFDRGNPDEGLRTYQQAIDADPADPHPYLARGQRLVDLGRHEAALADLSRTIKMAPEWYGPYLERSRAFAGLGRLEEGLADVDRAIERSRDNPLLIVARGYFLYQWRRFDEAVAEYDRALGLKKDLPVAYLNRSLAKFALKDFEGARDDAAAAIKLEPKNGWNYNNRAIARFALGDAEGAEEDLTQAITLTPDCTIAYLNRGDAREHLGRWKGALDDLQKYLQLEPKARGADAVRRRIDALKAKLPPDGSEF